MKLGLSNREINAISSLRSAGIPASTLASAFGISQTSVYDAAKNNTNAFTRQSPMKRKAPARTASPVKIS